MVQKYIDEEALSLLDDLIGRLMSRVKALEYKIRVLKQTDWYQGIDDEVLSIKWLTEQIERVSKGKPLKRRW